IIISGTPDSARPALISSRLLSGSRADAAACHFPIRRAVRCVRCALGWTERELRLDRGLDPERLTRAPRLPYKGSRGPHEEKRAKIGRQEIRRQEDSSGKSSDLARAVGANRLARHPGAQSEGRRLQRRRGSRTGRDSRLLMALSLARASAQIQAYVDFLHQLTGCRRARSNDSRTAPRDVPWHEPYAKASGRAWRAMSSLRCGFARFPANPPKPSWGSIAGSGPLVRCAPSWATASRRR